MSDDRLSIKEFAAAVGVSEATVRLRILAGKLAAVEVPTGPLGFRYMIEAGEVGKYRAHYDRDEQRRQERTQA